MYVYVQESRREYANLSNRQVEEHLTAKLKEWCQFTKQTRGAITASSPINVVYNSN